MGHALQLLAKRHILSAPLVILPGLEDMEGADADGAAAPPQLIGWVTVESILRAFLQREWRQATAVLKLSRDR